MDQLASDTGGRVINVGHDGKRLEDAFNQIQEELRTQYLLSYTPTNAKADGTFRKIDLNCGKQAQDPDPQRLLRHLQRRRRQLS
jgi:VWFA-related protein